MSIEEDLYKYQVKSITPVDKYVCTLCEESQKLAFAEYGETEELRQNSIREIREWALANPRIEKMRLDSMAIIRTLRHHRYNIKCTKESMERYLIFHEGLYGDDWFSNLDFHRPNLQTLLDSGLVIILPDYGPSGERIICTRLCAASPKIENVVNSGLCLSTQMMEILFEDEENQVRGFQYVFDVTGITLRNYFMKPFSFWYKLLKNCERTFAGKHRKCHILNLPKIVLFALNLAFRHMRQEMREGIKLYSSVDDLKDIDKDKLPTEMGGKASLKEITDSWTKKLEEYRPFFLNYKNLKINHEYYTEDVLNCEVKTLARSLENPKAKLIKNLESK